MVMDHCDTHAFGTIIAINKSSITALASVLLPPVMVLRLSFEEI